MNCILLIQNYNYTFFKIVTIVTEVVFVELFKGNMVCRVKLKMPLNQHPDSGTILHGLSLKWRWQLQF